MKEKIKWISLLCVFCLLLSSCSMLGLGSKEKSKQEEGATEKEVQAEKDKAQQDEKDQKDDQDQKDKKNSKKKDKNKIEKTTNKKPKKKTIDPENIRQISFEDIINPDVYTGFSKKQQKMLEENGFIIMEPNFDEGAYLKMHNAYERLDYSNGSVIITTDTVLHMWHVFYAESMKALEVTKYLPNLKEISLAMENKAIEEYQSAPDALDGAYANIIAFFHVANTLLEQEDELDEEPMGDAIDIAEAELALIEGQSGNESEMLDRMIDYSQFVVRGHYTTNPELTKYFKTMMWYGYMGFDLEKQGVEAALIADMIADDKDLMNLWTEIYQITTLYSGESDDILIGQMTEALEGFDDLQQELANEKGLKKLLKAYEKLPAPKIVAKLSEENEGYAVEKVFKFMGQRFSVDAYIMQNLMKPMKRAIPTAFDVFTAMGSETAEKVLRETYETNQNWPEYDDVLKQMTEEYAAGELSAADTLYNGWIRAIDHTLNYVPEGTEIPHFMASPAYEYKKLNTALGSFAELKHDNILYSKQAMAEMGGPDENLTLHYLEPNEDLYQELMALSTHAEKLLKKAGVEEKFLEPLENIKGMMKSFAEISRKELNGEDISQEELQELISFGGLVEALSTQYLYMLAADGYDFKIPKTSAVIADIATILPTSSAPGGYLEVATGLPYDIYALCHVNGVDFLARGIVFSAFEFLAEERWMDENWHEALGIEEPQSEYAGPSINPEKYDNIRGIHMDYYAEFSTGEPNQVEHIYNVEVEGWPKLK